MLSGDEIKRYLNEINERMAQDGVCGEVIICGGAVMSMVFGARDATKDIDALFEPASDIRRYAAEIADRDDLDERWFNDAAKGFIDTSKMTFEPVLEMSNLTVRRPTDEEMLALKLTSARDQSFDLSDALYLMRRIRIRDLDEVFGIMQRYMPPNRLTPLAGFFAEEAFTHYQRDLIADELESATETIPMPSRGIASPASLDPAEETRRLQDAADALNHDRAQLAPRRGRSL